MPSSDHLRPRLNREILGRVLLFLWFRSIGAAKSDLNLCANSVNLFLRQPLLGLIHSNDQYLQSQIGIRKSEIPKPQSYAFCLLPVGNNPLIHLKTAGRIGNTEYQTLLGVAKRTAHRDLTELVERGILEKVGTTGRGTAYVLHKGAKGIIEWITGKWPIRLIKDSNGSGRS